MNVRNVCIMYTYMWKFWLISSWRHNVCSCGVNCWGGAEENWPPLCYYDDVYHTPLTQFVHHYERLCYICGLFDYMTTFALAGRNISRENFHLKLPKQILQKGTRSSRVMVFIVTYVILHSNQKMVWKFTEEKHTKNTLPLRKCESHPLNLLWVCHLQEARRG